jgi:hypothetical protein
MNIPGADNLSANIAGLEQMAREAHAPDVVISLAESILHVMKYAAAIDERNDERSSGLEERIYFLEGKL